MSHILLNYAFLLLPSILGEIHRELFFLVKKSDYLRNEHLNSKKFVFLTMFEKGQILRKIWICLNNFFWLNKQKGININKNCFIHKLKQILLNYAFLLFWSLLGEIHRILFFLDIKVTISETSTEIRRKFIFLTMFEMGKSWEKFRFV